MGAEALAGSGVGPARAINWILEQKGRQFGVTGTRGVVPASSGSVRLVNRVRSRVYERLCSQTNSLYNVSMSVDQGRAVRHVVDRVAFQHADGWYIGHGVLDWDPGLGLTLDAFVTRHGTPPPNRVSIRSIDIKSPVLVAAQMQRAATVDRGVFYAFPRLDEMDLISRGRIHVSMESPDATFLRREHRPRSISASGGALFGLRAKADLSDRLTVTKSINDIQVEHQWNFSAIDLESDGLVFRAYHDSNAKMLHVGINGNRKRNTRRDMWSLVQSSRLALILLLKQSVPLVEATATSGGIQRIYMSKSPSDVDSGWLTILGTSDEFDKDAFWRLTEFLASESRDAKICARLIRRIESLVSRVPSELREWLIASTLEMTLRTMDRDRSSRWSCQNSLGRFRKAHLPGEEWAKVCSDVLASWTRLRNRRAHPYFDGVDAKEVSSGSGHETIDDMRKIIRFYDHIVFALADIGDVKATLPVPVTRTPAWTWIDNATPS